MDQPWCQARRTLIMELSSRGRERTRRRMSLGSLVRMTDVVPAAGRTTDASIGSERRAAWQSSPAARAIASNLVRFGSEVCPR